MYIYICIEEFGYNIYIYDKKMVYASFTDLKYMFFSAAGSFAKNSTY